jgi:hypothetical protein
LLEINPSNPSLFEFTVTDVGRHVVIDKRPPVDGLFLGVHDLHIDFSARHPTLIFKVTISWLV